jgi:hypothetical protein
LTGKPFGLPERYSFEADIPGWSNAVFPTGRPG